MRLCAPRFPCRGSSGLSVSTTLCWPTADSRIQSPVSVCRALGAEVQIAVNLNGDLQGRRFKSELHPEKTATPLRDPSEFVSRLLPQLPAGLREQAAQIAPRLLAKEPSTPGYFDVLANSINIMQDSISRARLAGDPPHVLLVSRLGHIGLMEYNRAKESIAEGRFFLRRAGHADVEEIFVKLKIEIPTCPLRYSALARHGQAGSPSSACTSAETRARR